MDFKTILVEIDEERDEKSLEYVKLQEKSGFLKRVIALPEEDVWNDM